jgi:hypothetical protein
MGIRKMTAKGEWGKVLDTIGKPYALFFSGSFIRGSHVCIVPVFLNNPAVSFPFQFTLYPLLLLVSYPLPSTNLNDYKHLK